MSQNLNMKEAIPFYTWSTVHSELIFRKLETLSGTPGNREIIEQKKLPIYIMYGCILEKE